MSREKQKPHYQLIDSEKIARRGEHGLTHSRWRLTFLTDTGTTLRVLANCESTPDHNLLRKERYAATGTSATFKRLSYSYGGIIPSKILSRLPQLGLKSFHKNHFQHRKLSFPPNEATLQQAAHMFRAHGYSALVGKRPSPSTSERLYMILESIGNGEDMAAIVDDISKDAPPLLSTAPAMTSFLTAYIEAVAYVAFFHQQYQRAIIDIKPENMLVVTRPSQVASVPGTEVARFITIDLDNSFFNNFTFSPFFMSACDFPALRRAHTTKNFNQLGTAIDFHTLANTLACCAAGMSSQYFSADDNRIFNRILGISHAHFTVDINPAHHDSLLCQLHRTLLAFTNNSGPISTVINATLKHHQDGDNYTGIFEAAMTRYQRNYHKSIALNQATAHIPSNLSEAPRGGGGGKPSNETAKPTIALTAEQLPTKKEKPATAAEHLARLSIVATRRSMSASSTAVNSQPTTITRRVCNIL